MFISPDAGHDGVFAGASSGAQDLPAQLLHPGADVQQGAGHLQGHLRPAASTC